MNNSRRAWTLIELLVVVAIITLLSTFLLGAIGSLRRLALTAVCAGHQRQLGMAIDAYADDWRGLLPTARQGKYSNVYWYTLIGPYVDAKERAGTTTLSDLQDSSRTVIKGCPVRKKTGLDFEMGYSMNIFANMPVDRGNRNSWITISEVVRGEAPATYFFDWRRSRIGDGSLRVLVGDGGDWHISWTNGRWYGFQPRMHGTKSNYLFHDGRVAALAGPQAEHAITNPSSLPGYSYPGWP